MGLGFTAINSTASNVRADAGSDGITTDAMGATRSIVSQYLGRGGAEAPTPAGTKKTTTKGKKRAAPKADAPKSKKRRTSSIKNGMQVWKPLTPVDVLTVDNESRAAPKKQKKTSAKKFSPKADSVSTADGSDMLVAGRSVPVFSSATSMDALGSTHARTSIDSVKANAGQSFTLYEGSCSSNPGITNVDYSRPLMSSSKRKPQEDQRTNVAKPKTGSKRKTLTKPATKPAAAEKITSQDYADTEFFDDSLTEDDFELPRRSSRLANSAPKASTNEFIDNSHQSDGDEDFGSVNDDDLMELVRSRNRFHGFGPSTPPPRKKSQNMREVDEHEDYGGALLNTAEKKVLAEVQQIRDDQTVKPIVRKPFQPSVLDRSPIWGASNSTLLRTCFRLGEALNQGCQAVRCNQNLVIELYARVTSSWREEKPRRKQHFVFRDLYHDKPPHLEGTYELWDQAVLWDLDSKAFLRSNDEGIMCRAIAKMKREQQKWRLEVLSIWEAS